MLLGFGLLYVGAVLFLNGLWLHGKIDDREIAFINIVSGFATLFVVIYWAFGPGADLASVKGAALTLLFTATYFWVAYNRFIAVDGRGLGWFSLFVAVTTVPVALGGFATMQTTLDTWMAINWVIWGILWFMYFLLLAAKKEILAPTASFTVFAGIVTGWIPGYLILDGRL
jgi:hypothetical protein